MDHHRQHQSRHSCSSTNNPIIGRVSGEMRRGSGEMRRGLSPRLGPSRCLQDQVVSTCISANFSCLTVLRASRWSLRQTSRMQFRFLIPWLKCLCACAIQASLPGNIAPTLPPKSKRHFGGASASPDSSLWRWVYLHGREWMTHPKVRMQYQAPKMCSAI